MSQGKFAYFVDIQAYNLIGDVYGGAGIMALSQKI